MKYKTLLTVIVALAVAMTPMAARNKKKAGGKKSAPTTQVIYTGDIAKKVYGYNGATPLNIHIKDGRIERIEALPNNETPSYFKRATSKIFPQYEGKTVAEARALHVDAVSGATYSSEAIIKNIQMGLQQYDGGKTKGKK